MKQIKIRPVADKPGATTKEIISLAVGNSPQKQLTIDDIRKRVAIQEIMERSEDKESFVLEDAEYQVLVDAIQSFPWAQANRALLTIMDDVLNAETIAISDLKVVGKKEK